MLCTPPLLLEVNFSLSCPPLNRKVNHTVPPNKTFVNILNTNNIKLFLFAYLPFLI